MMPTALLAIVLIACSGGVTDQRPSRPLVGAIRWDGWWQGNPWQRFLDPPAWRDRLPFYGREPEQGRVEVVSDSQSIMEREILYATEAGLGFWAICYYHPSSWPEAEKYNYGWRRFLAARAKHGLRYCFILQGGQHMGPATEWEKTAHELAARMRGPSYLKVLGNRPLLFVFSGEYLAPHFGSREKAREAFEVLARTCRSVGLGRPYVVAQVFHAATGAEYVRTFGWDAIGAYSGPAHNEHREHTYQDLIGANRYYRQSFAATGLPVVPIINAGWDGRPRLVSSEQAKHYQGGWYAQPTPDELAYHVHETLEWVQANQRICPARLALIYAWNETDEGGWLVPTRYEGDARLRALRRVLRPEVAN